VIDTVHAPKQKAPPRTLRELILEEFLARKEKNERYSLRAFARDLGVSPSLLSQTWTGKRNLSPATAKKIRTRLNLPPHRAALFETFVARFGDAAEPIDVSASEMPVFVTEDIFQAMRQWYHIAILSLTEMPEFRQEPKWIAAKLKITSIEAELALERLVRLGLLMRTDDGVTKSHPSFRVEDVPSEAKRQFHKQMCAKQTAAVEALPASARHNTGVMIAASDEALEKARTALDRFCYQMRTELKAHGTPTRVMYLNVGLFPVDVG
jgi:uncharacterized protein (TIGR02147 family)